MILKNGSVLIGQHFDSVPVVFDQTILALGENAASARPDDTVFDASGCYVLPGFVDIHSHGGKGHDFTDADPEALAALTDYYLHEGVTSVLATIVTLPENKLKNSISTIAHFQSRSAKIQGINLEGPFLSLEKRGAHKEEYLQNPSLPLFEELYECGLGRVRLVTVAPELPGAIEFIREAVKRVTVSIGHSAADHKTAAAAFEAGATHVTHLFNAMPPLLHRAPGVIGAAFDAGASVELISDGLHVDPAVVRMTFAAFSTAGKVRVNLISDSIRTAGMPDGDYMLGEKPVTLKNGRATLRGTNTLAGASVSLAEGFRRAVRFGVPVEEVAYAASTAPANAAGLHDVGRISAGCAADLLIVKKDTLEIKAMFLDGQPVEAR